jgi:hypothetical protein
VNITKPDIKDMPYFSPPYLTNRAVLLAIISVLSACIYVPVVDEHEAASASCKTYTKSMTLEAIQLQGNIVQPACGTGDCAAAALASVIAVTAGSAIISGSIVLTGNTIHWLEYQGTCSDGYLGRAKRLFLDSIGKSKSAGAGEQNL